MTNTGTLLVSENLAMNTFEMVCPMVEHSKRKCQPNQGGLNQIIATAKTIVAMHGHKMVRFDRNYTAGTAIGICKHCSGAVKVNALSGAMAGSPLKYKCQK
jgi:hypothetical protein